MIRKTFISIFLSIPFLSISQTVSLSDCRKMAHDNYPAIKQYNMVESMREYNVSNAVKGWFPQISIQAGAYAFTDIINESEQTAQMGLSTKNHVASGLIGIRQNIYDGGQINAVKNVANAQADVQKHQLDITMHQVYEQVEQIFFGILTIDEQLRQNEILQNDLDVSAGTIKSLISGGLANQSDLDAITVEQIKAQQQADALSTSRSAYINMLGVFIGKTLNDDITLEKPSMILPVAKNMWGQECSEMYYYDSQNRLLESQRKQLDTKLRPTIGLMGAGIIHSTVTDLAHNQTVFGGITLSWNIGALYTRKNDIRKLDVKRRQNENMRETFLFNNRLQNEDNDGKISLLRKQLEKDSQIISLRENIRLSNETKVKLGTETVNELIRSINAVSNAKQQQSMHELQLLQAIYHSNTINN